MGFDSEDGSTTTYSLLGPFRLRVWQSLNTGHPPSFSLAYIDCGFPQYDASSNDEGGRFGSSCELSNKIYWVHTVPSSRLRFGSAVSLQSASRKLLLAFLQPKYHLTQLSWSLIVEFMRFHCQTGRRWFYTSGEGVVPNIFCIFFCVAYNISCPLIVLICI